MPARHFLVACILLPVTGVLFQVWVYSIGRTLHIFSSPQPSDSFWKVAGGTSAVILWFLLIATPIEFLLGRRAFTGGKRALGISLVVTGLPLLFFHVLQGLRNVEPAYLLIGGACVFAGGVLNIMSLPSTVSGSTSKNTVSSIILFALAFLSVLGGVAWGIGSLEFYKGEFEGGGFWFLGAVALGIATLLFVTLPSSLFLFRTRNPRFRASLRLSIVTLALLFVEFLAAVIFIG